MGQTVPYGVSAHWLAAGNMSLRSYSGCAGRQSEQDESRSLLGYV
jgi:hypothetical protein